MLSILALAFAGALSLDAAAAAYQVRFYSPGIKASNTQIKFFDNATNAAITGASFPNTFVGSSSAPITVKLQNSGPTVITFQPTPFTSAAPYSVYATTCAGTLAVGATCTLSIVFSPTTARVYYGGFLTINANIANLAVPTFSATAINPIVTQIVAGTSETFIQKSDGSWWGRGNNNYGGLGLGDTAPRSNFVPIPALAGATKVLVGNYYSMAIQADGTLVASGSNYYGALGLGNTTDTSVFTTVPVGTVTDLQTGSNYAYIKKADGTWAGSGIGYGMGLGDSVVRSSFMTTAFISSALDVAVHNNVTYLKAADGFWYATGQDKYGKLGTGDTAGTLRTTFKPIVGLPSSAKILRATGATGDSIFAQLADSSYMGVGYSCRNELFVGQVGYDSCNSFTYITTFISVPALNGVTKLYMGAKGTYALFPDGNWYAAGANGSGGMGFGDSVDGLAARRVYGLSPNTKITEALNGGATYGLNPDGTFLAVDPATQTFKAYIP